MLLYETYTFESRQVTILLEEAPPPEIPTWLKVLAALGVIAAVTGGVWLATRPKK